MGEQQKKRGKEGRARNHGVHSKADLNDSNTLYFVSNKEREGKKRRQWRRDWFPQGGGA